MNFISSHFLLFLFFSLFFYYLFPKKAQYFVLLVASLFFYLLISPIYTLLIIFLVFSDYLIANKILEAVQKRRGKILMLSGVSINVVVLLFFKFYYPVERIIAPFFPSLNLWEMKYFVEIAVPVGISYFIFKKISYLVDVYRGVIPPEKSFARLLLYVILFPEILAGPIDRASDLLSQFSGKIDFNSSLIISGFQRFLWGIFKKVVIADRIAIFVDIVFKSYRSYNRSTILYIVLLYSVQIYCDFSAIADIAIGIGKMFGINIRENFNRPYFSDSISDFWRRWHITLSTWLRDYIFLPIAYSISGKFSKIRISVLKSDNYTYFAASMITMLICGLWHGSGWTFVLWGGIHGLYLVISHLTGKTRKKFKKKIGLKRSSILNKVLKISVTFSLVSFSWIFFRSKSIYHAFGMINSIFSASSGSLKNFSDLYKVVLKDFPKFTLEIVIISIFVLIVVEILQMKINIGEWILNRPVLFRILFYYFAIFTILIFTVKKSGDFIYMKF